MPGVVLALLAVSVAEAATGAVCSSATSRPAAGSEAAISVVAAEVGAATAALVVSERAGIAAKTTLKAVKLTIAGARLIKVGFTVTPLH
jgi:hypothetical protein